MEQLKNFADDRLIVGCIYCGGQEDTRDHVPSRVLLDRPYPENLPVVGACKVCNTGFSSDEEYFACLIECVIAGGTEPNTLRRQTVADILRRAPALRARIDAAMSVIDGTTSFDIEEKRVKNVLLKLARGHVAFELGKTCRDDPVYVGFMPITLLSEDARGLFEAAHVVGLFGEVGSRAMQRMLVASATFQSQNGERSSIDMVIQDWTEVQDMNYRYLATEEDNLIRVRIVISEYLAVEFIWTI